jgi:hypothetical protein
METSWRMTLTVEKKLPDVTTARDGQGAGGV